MTNPALPDGYSGNRIDDIRNAPDGLIADIHAFKVKVKAEARPGEPSSPLADVANDIRRLPSEKEDWSYEIRDSSGELVGLARGGVERTGDNEHLFWFDPEVLVEHRRRGIGTWLLAQAAEAAHSAGAEMLSGWSTSRLPSGEHFARSFEGEARTVHRESELDLSTIDWALVDQWVEEGPGRAPGYALELTEGVYPESHYDDVVAWWEIMNTAPKDNLDWNDDHLTKERLAEWESQFAASSGSRWEYIARHLDSGACVGVTNVWFADWNPAVMHQGDTGVHPDHRGHALGKWLKAGMLQKIRAERPQARVIRTGNAYSNDAMLGINNALGFKESGADTAWQLPVERAQKLLS